MDNSNTKMPDILWQPYAHLLRQKEVPAKTILLRKEDVSVRDWSSFLK